MGLQHKRAGGDAQRKRLQGSLEGLRGLRRLQEERRLEGELLQLMGAEGFAREMEELGCWVASEEGSSVKEGPRGLMQGRRKAVGEPLECKEEEAAWEGDVELGAMVSAVYREEEHGGGAALLDGAAAGLERARKRGEGKAGEAELHGRGEMAAWELQRIREMMAMGRKRGRSGVFVVLGFGLQGGGGVLGKGDSERDRVGEGDGEGLVVRASAADRGAMGLGFALLAAGRGRVGERRGVGCARAREAGPWSRSRSAAEQEKPAALQ